VHGHALSTVSGAILDRRDRFILLGALAAVTTLAWGYLVLHAIHMDVPSAIHVAMGMGAVPWTAGRFVMTLVMWAVMMVAMMLPSAAPMVLTYSAVVGRLAPEQGSGPSVAMFAAAYLLVWLGFSVGVTLLQLSLQRVAVLSSTTIALGPFLGGGLLLVAGLYQLSPLKEFCLRKCHSPLTFIASNWRPGLEGAVRMGVRHGAYCVGCCWALMLLLFVGGGMNLLWVAAISVFVLVEKLLGAGTWRAQFLSGAGLIGSGAWLLSGM
jgi:predicted metal-binding membrane protein